MEIFQLISMKRSTRATNAHPNATLSNIIVQVAHFWPHCTRRHRVRSTMPVPRRVFLVLPACTEQDFIYSVQRARSPKRIRLKCLRSFKNNKFKRKEKQLGTKYYITRGWNIVRKEGGKTPWYVCSKRYGYVNNAHFSTVFCF